MFILPLPCFTAAFGFFFFFFPFISFVPSTRPDVAPVFSRLRYGPQVFHFLSSPPCHLPQGDCTPPFCILPSVPVDSFFLLAFAPLPPHFPTSRSSVYFPPLSLPYPFPLPPLVFASSYDTSPLGAPRSSYFRFLSFFCAPFPQGP